MNKHGNKFIFLIIFCLYAISLILLFPSMFKFINTSFAITVPDLWNTSTWQEIMRLFAIITIIFTLGTTCIFVFLIHMFFNIIINFEKIFNKEKVLNFEIIVMIITIFISFFLILNQISSDIHHKINDSDYVTINNVRVTKKDGFFTHKHYNVGNDIKRAQNYCSKTGGHLATIEDYEKIMETMNKYSTFEEYSNGEFYYFATNNSMWDKGCYYYSSSKKFGKNIILRVLPAQNNTAVNLSSPSCRKNSDGLYSCIKTVFYSQENYKSIEKLPYGAFRKFKCIK